MTVFDGCRVLQLVAKDPKECVKLVRFILMYYGQLKAYGDGAKPVVIEVNKPGLSVHFNTWYSKRTVSGRTITAVVTEAGCFCQKGRCHSLFMCHCKYSYVQEPPIVMGIFSMEPFLTHNEYNNA